jgi:hypothetical protein
VALDRAAYMASQAAGEPGPGNEEYDRVYANETQFALGHDTVLLDWAARHMLPSALAAYRVESA